MLKTSRCIFSETTLFCLISVGRTTLFSDYDLEWPTVISAGFYFAYLDENSMFHSIVFFNNPKLNMYVCKKC